MATAKTAAKTAATEPEETPTKKTKTKKEPKPEKVITGLQLYRQYYRLIFIEGLLGSAPNDQDLYRSYIANKAPDAKSVEEEVESVGVDEVVDKGTTVFSRERGVPFLWDHHFKGLLKGVTKADKQLDGTVANVKYQIYKTALNENLHPGPRKVWLHLNQELKICSRTLRASTPQGERISIARSEMAAPGTYVNIYIDYYDKGLQDLVEEAFNKGLHFGMGQWRNASYGRYLWQKLDGPWSTAKQIGGNFSKEAYYEYRNEQDPPAELIEMAHKYADQAREKEVYTTTGPYIKPDSTKDDD